MPRRPIYAKHVSVVNKKYVIYRPYIKLKERHLFETDKNGYLKPSIKLGTTDEPHDAILRKYLAAKEQIDSQKTPNKNTLSWISNEYQKSRVYRELSPSTQKHYYSMNRILEYPIKRDGQPIKLGDLLASELSKPVIQVIMEKRLEELQAGGKKGQAVVNYEARYLSSMMSWAVNFVPGIGIHDNPLKGLKRMVEPRNERYVTDDEYNKQHSLAVGYLPFFFELSYLCAARRSEILKLDMSDILEEGIRIRRTKGSKHNIIRWSPRLRAAIDSLLNIRKESRVRKIGSHQPLLVDKNGNQISVSALKSAMGRLKRKMEKLGIEDQYWSLHLLKHKGISDSENKDIGGHKSENMKQRYNQKLDIIKPPK